MPVTTPFLQGPFAPVTEEVTAFDLPVTGRLPAGLSGRYPRNGPNPLGLEDPNYHWFVGAGMVHGVRLRARYASRPPCRAISRDTTDSSRPTENAISLLSRPFARPREMSSRKSGISSCARQGSGVRASFSTKQQDELVECIAGHGEVAPPRWSHERFPGRDRQAYRLLDPPRHAAIMAQQQPVSMRSHAAIGSAHS